MKQNCLARREDSLLHAGRLDGAGEQILYEESEFASDRHDSPLGVLPLGGGERRRDLVCQSLLQPRLIQSLSQRHRRRFAGLVLHGFRMQQRTEAGKNFFGPKRTPWLRKSRTPSGTRSPTTSA